jgi:GR25 family glycosyltransferase involved in LPS biosynthesis
VHEWYREAPQNVERYNYYGWDAFSYDEGAEPLNIPALIFSHVRERRSSAYRMAAAAGFTDIAFARTLPYQEVDLADLKKMGAITDDFMKTHTLVQQQKFAAHALDFLDAARLAVFQGHSWVAMFEDDVVLTSPPSVASKRIREALLQVPPFCDCIYLEYCNDLCEESRFHEHKEGVSTAVQPFCSAAILYSSSGLLKLQQHLVPVVNAIDNMLADLCLKMLINCFKLRLPVYAQDRFWGSQVTPELKAREAFHALLYQPSLCRELPVDSIPLCKWAPDHFHFYKEAATQVRRYNLLGSNAHASNSEPEDIAVKVFILNHIKERHGFAQWMVQSAGFHHVEFPSTIAWAEIDPEALADAGKTVPNFMAQQTEVHRKKYLAHALDYINTLDQAVAEGHSWVAVFEDDVILTTRPSEASRRIRLAMEQVPRDADSIHLEWCLDQCRLARVREGPEVVVSTAERPSCSAAILYSAQGLRKALRVLQPLFSAIDKMLADVCERRLLNCYKLRFPAFAQDMYWGSELARKTRTSMHELDSFNSLCIENDAEWRLNRKEIPVHSSLYHLVVGAETTIVGKVHHFYNHDATVARQLRRQVRHPDEVPVAIHFGTCQRTEDGARQAVIYKIRPLDPSAVYLFTLELKGLNVISGQTVRGPMKSNFELLEEWETSGEKKKTKILRFMYAFTCSQEEQGASAHETVCSHHTEFELLLPPADAGAVTALASVYDTHHDVQRPEDGRDLLARTSRIVSRGSGSCPDEVAINTTHL